MPSIVDQRRPSTWQTAMRGLDVDHDPHGYDVRRTVPAQGRDRAQVALAPELQVVTDELADPGHQAAPAHRKPMLPAVDSGVFDDRAATR